MTAAFHNVNVPGLSLDAAGDRQDSQNSRKDGMHNDKISNTTESARTGAALLDEHGTRNTR
jgi:hypothetical protein